MNEGPDLDRWLPELEPPPGGLTALRERLARRESRRAVARFSYSAAAVVVLALVSSLLWFAPTRDASPLAIGDDLIAIRLGLLDAPSELVSVAPDRRHKQALQRVATRDERVALYLAGSI
ncbi:MAG: hypothetical protein JSV80_02575 [Acidobacteriota bacterium]|nr:MAG: hypothetical protein JSV80_02575 [Acidobacteriota bacterium]